MTVDFTSSKLRKLCMEQVAATVALGPDSARKLRSRLSDLKAARCVTELIAGRPHPYKGEGERRFSLDLAGGARLLFVPTLDPPPMVGEAVDWGAVTEVTIVFLGDNHDD